MGSDWNAPRDKGPQINESECVKPSKKKKKKKKKFTIEYMRHPNPDSQFGFGRDGHTWKLYRKYSTESARDQALASIIKKHFNSTYVYYRQYRFRKGDP